MTARRPDLFAAGAALGFPQLPIRPAVSVIAGRAAWQTFTANGTEEDVIAARIAVAARLTEKAQRGDLCGFPAGVAPSAYPAAEKAQRRDGCAFCGASLDGRRPHARCCSARCRAAASDRRRAEGRQDHAPTPAGSSLGGPAMEGTR